jgi:hypothetical protein
MDNIEHEKMITKRNRGSRNITANLLWYHVRFEEFAFKVWQKEETEENRAEDKTTQPLPFAHIYVW